MPAKEGTRPLVQEVLGRLTADRKHPERSRAALIERGLKAVLAGVGKGLR